MDRDLYAKISKAREACAGCDIKPITEVRSLLKEAIEYIHGRYHRDAPEFLLKSRLKMVYRNLEPIPGRHFTYGDRLGPDQALCDILNEMLEQES